MSGWINWNDKQLSPAKVRPGNECGINEDDDFIGTGSRSISTVVHQYYSYLLGTFFYILYKRISIHLQCRLLRAVHVLCDEWVKWCVDTPNQNPSPIIYEEQPTTTTPI